MKVSRMDLEALLGLSWEEKWSFICGDQRDNGETADVALLLGTSPEIAIERARTAAELYRLGRVKYILASGGVKWKWDGAEISEAELMRNVLVREGVPDEVIFLDNESRNTLENMVYSTFVIIKSLKISKIDSVIVVTSETHMKRSLALAKAFLPRKLRIFGCPSYGKGKLSMEDFLSSEENRKCLNNCISLIKYLVDTRVVEDMEI